jgi:hypothetical protein
MTGNLWQDWPVFVFLGAVVVFFIYVIIKGNQGGKNKNNEPPAGKVS